MKQIVLKIVSFKIYITVKNIHRYDRCYVCTYFDKSVRTSTQNDRESLNVSDSGLTGIPQLFDGLPYRLSSVLLPLFLLNRVFSFPGMVTAPVLSLPRAIKTVYLIRPANSFNRYQNCC